MKKQRISLLIDFELYKKMRILQAKKIRKTKNNVSFSQLVEDLVKAGMEN